MKRDWKQQGWKTGLACDWNQTGYRTCAASLRSNSSIVSILVPSSFTLRRVLMLRAQEMGTDLWKCQPEWIMLYLIDFTLNIHLNMN